MDQRTRERLPVLPLLVRTANDRHRAAADLLAAANAAEAGAMIDGTEGLLRKAVTQRDRTAQGRPRTARPTGRDRPQPRRQNHRSARQWMARRSSRAANHLEAARKKLVALDRLARNTVRAGPIAIGIPQLPIAVK